jgi:uncharacterized protein involved in exopolysaccharide biosynthesis
MFVLPKKYTSTAKLFVRLGRESVMLDPTATTGQTIQVQESRENQINSARDMLSSRVLLQKVVDRFSPDVILNGPKGSEPTGVAAVVADVRNMLPSMEFSGPVSPEEKAIDKLAKAIKVEAARNSSVIDVRVTAKSPTQAQTILEAFLDVYQDEYLTANRTSGSRKFFAEQTEMLKKQFEQTSADLRDAKNESGLVSISVEQQALQNQLVQIEAQIMAAKASQASSEASIASLKKSLAALPERMDSGETVGYPNVAKDSMTQELYKLQIELADLESNLAEDHPRLKIMRDKVQQAQTPVAVQASGRVQSTTAVNPARQSLLLDLNREEALQASHRAKTEKLDEQYASLKGRLKLLNDHEVEIAALEHQVTLAKSNYRMYSENYEQARIDNALEASRISPVNIIQPASFVEKPSAPNPLLILGAALAAAMGGSCIIAFGSEYRANSRKNSQEVAQTTSS